MRAGSESGLAMPAWQTFPPFLRFLLVGGLNAAFAYGVYWVLLVVGVAYPLAVLASTVAGVCFNFFTTGRLVFGRIFRARSLPRYVLVYAVVYFANVTLIAALVQTGLGAAVAGFIALFPMALLSFVLLHRFVFGPRHAAD